MHQEPVRERRRLLERIPPGSSVLDVGCWSGFAGRFLMEHRGAVVDGVEPNPAMAAIATHSYRRVLVQPIETALEVLARDTRRYDALLLLDVLEHLADPQQVLTRLSELVGPNGRALLSIPNTAHWSVRKELALGRWDYREYGLLDRTHLRFFTLDSALEMIDRAGWRPAALAWSLGQPPVVRLPEGWLALLRFWPRVFGVQMLLDIRPKAGEDQLG